jgi:putative inorganic carbon (HCO3(-)) transporter
LGLTIFRSTLFLLPSEFPIQNPKSKIQNSFMSAWSRLTFAGFSPTQWRGSSYLYRLIGFFGSWRQSSWLLQRADALGAVLIAAVLALGPFVSSGLIGVLLAAIAGYWLLVTLSDIDRPAASPIHLLVLLYWSLAGIAVAFSPVRAAAFSGWVKLTLYFAFFALAARVLRSPRLTNWLVTLTLLVALVVSAYGVKQQLFGVEQLATWNDPTSPLAQETRVYSFLGNPNLLASYLLPPLALSLAAVFAWRGWLPKALAVTMVGMNVACIYFTGSRGGWIGTLALIVVVLLLLYVWWRDLLPTTWRKWLLPVVFGGLAGFLAIAVLLVEPLRLRVLSIFAGRGDSSNNFRMNVWSAVVEMIRDRPLIGIGPGNVAFNKVYPLYMRPRFSALSAYSILLETAVETGIIGLTVLLWLIATTFSQGVRQIQQLRQQGSRQGFWLVAALAGMAGILAHGFVDTVWYRPEINTLWWLMVALIASRYDCLSDGNSAVSSRLPDGSI